MRFLSATVVWLVLVASAPLAAHAQHDPAAERPEARTVDVDTVGVPAAAASGSARSGRATPLVAALPARRVDDFTLVGVTWDDGFDADGLTVQVRQHSRDGWGPWTDLELEGDGGQGGRDGTAPLWVGGSDGVAARVGSPTGQRPPGLAISTIDPGTATVTPASTGLPTDAGATAVTQAADTTATYTPKPAIISRASWGARRNTSCDSPRTGRETRGVVVHHTAGSNGYSADESASVVRAVQAYHMDAREWCDIGYNFLVDRFGRTFEGRSGGVDRPVRGAHAGNDAVNTSTMGVSMMGRFSSQEPSAATKDAMVDLVSWRIGTTFHPATGSYSIGGRRLDRIAGHRDVVGTACPGEAAYAWLGSAGGLRERVAARVRAYSSDIETRFRALTTDRTGPVFIGEYPFSTGAGGRKARLGKVDIYSSAAGTFSVSDVVRSRYASVRDQSGPLGLPTGPAEATTRSTVRVQRFASGTIYRVRRTTTAAYALWGGLEDRYRRLGEADSSLGAPTRTQTRISGGRQRAHFVHGHLTLSSNGTVTMVRS